MLPSDRRDFTGVIKSRVSISRCGHGPGLPGGCDITHSVPVRSRQEGLQAIVSRRPLCRLGNCGPVTAATGKSFLSELQPVEKEGGCQVSASGSGRRHRPSSQRQRPAAALTPPCEEGVVFPWSSWKAHYVVRVHGPRNIPPTTKHLCKTSH